MATGQKNEILISFESGHYKKVRGEWKGDSVWAGFVRFSNKPEKK